MSDEASTSPDSPYSSSIDARNSAGLIVGNNGTVNQQFVVNQPLSREEIQNRKNLSIMRQAVRKFWIEGVLNQSLYHEALIRLNMTERADAVDNRPWNLLVQATGQASTLLPPNTRILDVFDQMQQRLLILGEPGSGKTTTLLELARELLNRADSDPTLPTPVVFNLSSWAERRPPLAEWLVDELRTRYSIPKDIAQDWVKRDALIVLLDGLDEVQAQHREACVQAINDFRQAHIVPLAVCSRAAEYERLTQQLKLQGAVLLQPLTAEQTEAYLDRSGESLSALRAALQHDPDLREMAESPLLLSIMTLAYQGASAGEVSALEGMQTRRQHLFDTYIVRMFVRREVKPLFSPLKIVGSLRWLAQRLMQYGQTTFLIERMQPGWLQPTNRRPVLACTWMTLWAFVYCLGLGASLEALDVLVSHLYFMLMTNWFFGSIVGLRFIDALNYGLPTGLNYGLPTGLIVGLIIALIDGLSGGFKTILLVERAGKVITRLKSGLYMGLIVGVISSLIAGLVFGLIENLYYGLIGGIFYGLSHGLLGGLVGLIQEIRPVKLSNLSLKSMRVNVSFGLSVGIAFGLSDALILGIIFGLSNGLTVGLVFGLSSGLIGGLIITLVIILAFESVSFANVSEEIITGKPNQMLRNATWSIWQLTLIGWLIIWLMDWLSNRLNTWTSWTLILLPPYLVIVSVVGGLLGGLIGGADIVIKHYLLRLALWLKGSIPFNYVRFLDHAASLIFLRKVGGGYIFVHRLVMEHFAGLSNGDIQRIISAIPGQSPSAKK